MNKNITKILLGIMALLFILLMTLNTIDIENNKKEIVKLKYDIAELKEKLER